MLHILSQTIVISFFVLGMILLIEYINVKTSGRGNNFIKKHTTIQILISTLLGLIPGCLGSYTIVSLYTHNVIGFGALFANLVATTGDEAFFMWAMAPSKALFISLILCAVAIIGGLGINFIEKKNNIQKNEIHFKIHKSNEIFSFPLIKEQLRNITFSRAALLLFTGIFLALILCGIIECGHDHGASLTHSHNHEHSILEPITITFISLCSFLFFIFLTASNHFIKEHVVHHILEKHLLKVFLWTLLVLSIIHILNDFLDVQTWISNNQSIILVIAILVGIIPESGPHLVFISLFLSGTIPFSVLLANSIVQDGHGALPLFAEHKKDFFLIKVIKIIIALIFYISFALQ